MTQEIVKAITNKFVPIHQFFYFNCIEVLPDVNFDNKEVFDESIKEHKLGSSTDKYESIQRIVGNQVLERIKDSKVFMVGVGAIGCELLKNFAMLGIGVGTQGNIIITDPDVIEVSNLNRQFLF